MATTKVKGTSKKIKELRGIEDIRPEKITDEQLEKVQSVINEINRAQMELGQMETKKHAMLHHVSMSQEAVGKLRDTFEKEYGTADVNIQDGVINYPKENGEVNKED